MWGNLTLCGSGSLTATGSQCGILVYEFEGIRIVDIVREGMTENDPRLQ